ncbi:hypothetical protein JTB14_035783 [Gonioctena quinquepunctata]|nr:hypothetical protein JTB14_035783 [Gonioctena quinquepunctata]
MDDSFMAEVERIKFKSYSDFGKIQFRPKTLVTSQQTGQPGSYTVSGNTCKSGPSNDLPARMRKINTPPKHKKKSRPTRKQNPSSFPPPPKLVNYQVQRELRHQKLRPKKQAKNILGKEAHKFS